MHIYVWGGSHPWVLGLEADFATRHFAIVYTAPSLLRNTLLYSTLCYTQHFAIFNTLLHPTLCYRLHCTLLLNTPQLHKLSWGPHFQTAPHFQTDKTWTKNAQFAHPPCATHLNSINCPGLPICRLILILGV